MLNVDGISVFFKFCHAYFVQFAMFVVGKMQYILYKLQYICTICNVVFSEKRIPLCAQNEVPWKMRLNHKQ